MPTSKTICRWRAAALAAWLTLAMGLGQLAGAAEPAADAEEKEKTSTKLEDVVVSGGAETFTGIEATSATVLDNAQIVDRVYVTPLDILKLSPGVSVQQFNNGGVPRGVQMRGFPWASHGNEGYFAIDGMPINDSGADTNQIIPEEVERVEIIKGPASALYGNYASAGSIHFHTYQRGDFTRFKLQYGSFNTQDAAAVLARKDGNWDHVYALEAYHSDGYQNNSDYDKQIGAARWTYHLGRNLDAYLRLRAFNSTWDAPGTITQAQYDSDPKQASNDVNGGWKKRGQGQGGLIYRFGDASKINWSVWAMNQDYERWYQAWVSPTRKSGSNYGYNYLFNHEMAGSTLAYSYLGKVWERETRLELGLDWQRCFQTREYWYLMVGQGRNRGAKYQDDEITTYTTSLYGELNHQIFKRLRLVIGSRYDMFDGHLERINGSSYDNDGPRVFSPKAGLIFNLLTGYDLYANYGKGFALPYDVDYVSRDYLEPAIRTQYELGLRAKPNSWSDFGVALWRMDTTDDFQTSTEDPSRQENAGQTRRQGIELETNLRPWRHLHLHLDYAYTKTEYLDFVDSSGARRDGNELRYVPHHIFNAELAWQPPQGWGGVSITVTSPRPTSATTT